MSKYILNTDLNADTVTVHFDGLGYIPARMYGHPDTWEPAEGGEIEITSIMYKGVEIMAIVSDVDWEKLEQECYKFMESNDED